MSLILDALRKSEAERQRGQAPSLHSPASRNRVPRRNWPLAGTVAALALVGGTSWIVLRTDAPTPSADRDALAGASTADRSSLASGAAGVAPSDGSLSMAAPLQRESAPMMATDVAFGGAPSGAQTNGGSGGGEWPDPALNVAATGAAQPFHNQTVTLPPVLPGPETAMAQPSEPVVVASAVPPVEGEVPRRVDGLGDPTVRPFSPSEAIADSVQPESVTPSLPTIHELEFNVRRELPKLNMSMLVYAKDPERRFALVNGKRYVPGGEAIDGKVLVVDVLPDGLVCEINGQRFLLPRQ